MATAAAARDLLQQGRSLDAVRAFDALLAGSTDAPLRERAPLLLERAQAYLALQLYRRCLTDCNAVLAESPMLPEAVRLKVAALFAMKKYAHIETLLLRFLGRAECDQGSELTAALRQLLERAQALLQIPAKGGRGSGEGGGGAAAAGAAATGASLSTSRARLLSLDTKIMLVKVGFATQTKTPAGAFDAAIAADKLANLEAATGGMDHPSGDFDQDVKVVLSYMLLNNAHYDEAIPLLNTILEEGANQQQKPVVVDAKCFAALLSRGSARAMKGGGHAHAAGGAAVTAPQAIELMEGAVADFSKATEVNPQSAVAFQKLGQVRRAGQ
jgi:tetratricopeptide (TPR) repeat protein